jgi:hypothetical protein
MIKCSFCGEVIKKDGFHHCRGYSSDESVFIRLVTMIKKAGEGEVRVGSREGRTYVGRYPNNKIYDGLVPLEAPLWHKTEPILDDFTDACEIFAWTLSNDPGDLSMFGFSEADQPIVEAIQSCGEKNITFFLAQISEMSPIYAFAVGLLPNQQIMEFHKIINGRWECYPEFVKGVNMTTNEAKGLLVEAERLAVVEGYMRGYAINEADKNKREELIRQAGDIVGIRHRVAGLAMDTFKSESEDLI